MVARDRHPSSGVWLTITGHPLPCFSKVLILKADKVLCFDTLLEVFILKVLRRVGTLDRRGPLPMFLKRYDFKRVRGWGSANDMREKELREQEG
jgi:hypothetical protein